MDDSKTGGLSGSDLQRSQSGGKTGDYGGNMDQRQNAQAGQGGQQIGGGAVASDMGAGGGSSGTGGYGNAQNQENHQGQASQASYGNSVDRSADRGAAYDEAQGGGRGSGSVSQSDAERFGGNSGDFDAEEGSGVSDIERDQREHQDRGQGSLGQD